MNNMCKFYVETARGRRCILISFKEWRMRRNQLVNLCENGGKNCAILIKYYRMTAKISRNKYSILE